MEMERLIIFLMFTADPKVEAPSYIKIDSNNTYIVIKHSEKGC